MKCKHSKVSEAPAPADTSKAGGPDWNADHVLTGSRVDFGAYLYLGADYISNSGSLRESGATVTCPEAGHLAISYPTDATKGHVIITPLTGGSSFSSFKARYTYSHNAGVASIDVYMVNSGGTPENPEEVAISVIGIRGV